MSGTDQPDDAHGDQSASRLAMDRLLERPITSEALDENTRLVGQRHEDVESDELTVLVARIGEEWLGFDAHFADRVHAPTAIRRVPHRTAEHLAGVAAVQISRRRDVIHPLHQAALLVIHDRQQALRHGGDVGGTAGTRQLDRGVPDVADI